MNTAQKTAHHSPHLFFASLLLNKDVLSPCICFISLCFFCTVSVSAADSSTSTSTSSSTATWVIGAEKFKYSQVQSREQSEQDAAAVLPQLILEQLVSGEVRTLPAQEVLDRKLDTLLTERLSLFLQLSKEVQARDTLVLSKIKPRDLEKAISEENKKIADLQKKIAENLSETQTEIDSTQSAVDAENAREAQMEADEDEDSDGTAADKTVVKSATDKSTAQRKRQFPFQFPFFRKDDKTVQVNETVALYKSDITALFEATAAASEAGYESRLFEREVVAAKINGLLSGSIVSYGEYAAVTAELHLYPGGKSAGTITEIGLLSDPLSIAKRIARYLSPKIANSIPVTLVMKIQPEEAAEQAKMTIDGIVYTKIPETAVVDAGIHTITIESRNFEMASLTYQFTGNERFTVRAELVPTNAGTLKLRLEKYKDGIFYANGVEEGHPDEETHDSLIRVNGKAVLGLFTTGEGDEKKSAFFYIPVDKAQDDQHLAVNLKPYDRAANIDKRRRRMYTAYSALICTLPVSFYCAGNFTSAKNAYNLDRGTYDDAYMWQNRLYASAAVSGVCGAWFLFELARYLYAANEVLPAAVKIDTHVITPAPETEQPVSESATGTESAASLENAASTDSIKSAASAESKTDAPAVKQ